MPSGLKSYRSYIDQFDLTEEQKLELVNAIAEVANRILEKRFQVYSIPKND